MTGVEADLEVAELGREMSMVTMGNGIPPLSLTLARTSWRDPELGTTVSETRIDLGTGWYLTPYGDRGERGYAWRWAAGLSWVRLDLAGSDKDMRALGCFGRMGLLLGAWRSCEAEIRGSVHGWVGGDDHGIQAAAEVVVGFGVAKTF